MMLGLLWGWLKSILRGELEQVVKAEVGLAAFIRYCAELCRAEANIESLSSTMLRHFAIFGSDDGRVR